MEYTQALFAKENAGMLADRVEVPELTAELKKYMD